MNFNKRIKMILLSADVLQSACVKSILLCHLVFVSSYSDRAARVCVFVFSVMNPLQLILWDSTLMNIIDFFH